MFELNAYISVLLLSSACLTLFQENEVRTDPVLVSLQTQLESELGDLDSAPKFEIPESSAGKSLILRYKTRKYMIYPRTKSGRLGRELVEREGPDDEGIMVRIHVQKKGEVNQPLVPQTAQEPYWSTDLNVYPVENSEKQLYVALSYRGWTDKKLIEKVKEVIKQVDAGND